MRGVGILRTDTPTEGIAGADCDDIEHRRLERRGKQQRERDQCGSMAHATDALRKLVFRRRRVAGHRALSRARGQFLADRVWDNDALAFGQRHGLRQFIDLSQCPKRHMVCRRDRLQRIARMSGYRKAAILARWERRAE